MDDDTKRYKIQVKGTAYTFRPIDLNALAKLGVVQAMGPSTSVLLKAMFGPLQSAADPEEWDSLTTRYVAGEVATEDLVSLLSKLTERTSKDVKTSDDGE